MISEAQFEELRRYENGDVVSTWTGPSPSLVRDGLLARVGSESSFYRITKAGLVAVAEFREKIGGAA